VAVSDVVLFAGTGRGGGSACWLLPCSVDVCRKSETVLCGDVGIARAGTVFACNAEGCKKRFAEAAALYAHARVHGDRPYVCHYDGCIKVVIDSAGVPGRGARFYVGGVAWRCASHGLCGECWVDGLRVVGVLTKRSGGVSVIVQRGRDLMWMEMWGASGCMRAM
jgi:hypothetical protein